MALLSSFLSVAESMPNPSGVWEYLLLNVFDGIVNYGWRIVVFTICLKLVLSPLDVLQRVLMKKNQKITARIKPEMDQLKMQYGHDRNLLMRKQNELNKREGMSPFSMMSSCLPMLVTLAIFFWMLAGMRNMGQYMTMKQYLHLYDSYESGYAICLEENGFEWDGESMDWVLTKHFDSENERNLYEVEYKTGSNSVAKLAGRKAAYDAYFNEYKAGFYWVKNIWSPDVPWKKPILEHDQFIKEILKYGEQEDKVGVSSAQLKALISADRYNEVTLDLRSDTKNNKVNGLLILPILSVGFTVLQQFIMIRQQKKSGQQLQAAGQNTKMMMIMMPLMMGYFSLQYTGVFTLYIFTSTLIGLVLNFATTGTLSLIDKLVEERKDTKKIEDDGSVVIRYGRRDPNDIINDNNKSSKTNKKK